MRAFLVVMSVLLLSLFVVLSKYEDRPVIRALDFAVTVKLQERIDSSSHLRMASFVGNLMEGATFFASPEFTVIATVLMTGFAIYDRKQRRWHLRSLIIPLALVAVVIVEIYSKSIVHHPAPMYSMIKNPTTIFPANYINEQFSYPSGHAARAIFLAGTFIWVLYARYGRKITRRVGNAYVGILAGSVCYVTLVAVSRIYLGHHWLSDVVGGLLLGGGCTCGAFSIMRSRSL